MVLPLIDFFTHTTMPVLLLTDSRGHGLSQFLDIEAPNIFRVSARSGDSITGLFKRAVKKLKHAH